MYIFLGYGTESRRQDKSYSKETKERFYISDILHFFSFSVGLSYIWTQLFLFQNIFFIVYESISTLILCIFMYK